MAKEIEHKYLIALTAAFVWDRKRVIESSYLSVRDPEVRVARYLGIPGSYQLTMKSGAGLVREEVILDLDDEKGAQLFFMGLHRVSKMRYNAGRWEIDVFLDRHFGLQMAEIELTDVAEPLPPMPPGIILLQNVTEDALYKNKFLASALSCDIDVLIERQTTLLRQHLQNH